DATRRDRWRPVARGFFHARHPRRRAHRGAVVVHAVGDARPAVVPAAPYVVDLVATTRAVLGRPDLAGDGVRIEPLRIAMSVAPDRGVPSRAPERIVVRHRTVEVQSMDLPVRAIQFLRHVLPPAVADAEVHVVTGDREARTVVVRRVDVLLD